MLTQQELQELVDLSSRDGQVVSLYLDVDPSRHSKDEYRLTLRKLFKEVAGRIPEEDASRIERYLELEHEWQGKSVAIFSSAADGVFRAFSLPVSVKDQVHVLNRAYIEPLSDLLDEYVVVLVAREGVRLFFVRAGQVEDVAGTFGPVPGRRKGGGWAASRLQRHANEMAQRNLREGVELLEDFCERTKCRRVLLAGTEENVHLFAGLLPKSLRDRVEGSFNLDAAASEAEVLERSLALIRQSNEEREQRLIDEIITAAAKGEHGAIGLADTLAAVQDGRARLVAVTDGFEAEGYRCAHCGFMSVQAVETCTFCGGDVERISDAVNGLIHRALESGVEVMVVRDNSKLREAGNIGALLRY